MNKNLIVFGIVAMLICVGLSGCTDVGEESKKFIGTWKSTGDSGWTNYTFLSNGTFYTIYSVYMSYVNGTWEIRNGKFVMTLNNGREEIRDYYFSDDGNTLTLIVSDDDELNKGLTFILIKQ